MEGQTSLYYPGPPEVFHQGCYLFFDSALKHLAAADSLRDEGLDDDCR